MIKTVRDAWKIPELRNKILFTIFALLIFRLGAAIRSPISMVLSWRPISQPRAVPFWG